MKVMIRQSAKGLSAYVAKKDLEEPIVSQEKGRPLGRRRDAEERLGPGPAGHAGLKPVCR